MFEVVKPADIEKRSFEMIAEILGDRVLPPENELIIKRVIHTTADFDYTIALFSGYAVARGVEALRNGCDIVTDTSMAMAGINKRVLAELGGRVHCFIGDSDVAQEGGARSDTFCCLHGARRSCKTVYFCYR